MGASVASSVPSSSDAEAFVVGSEESGSVVSGASVVLGDSVVSGASVGFGPLLITRDTEVFTGTSVSLVMLLKFHLTSHSKISDYR